jgi:hypothetical protein
MPKKELRIVMEQVAFYLSLPSATVLANVLNGDSSLSSFGMTE